MDDETRVFLRGAFQFLEKHQAMLDEVMIVTYALRKAIFELGPKAAEVYAKYYQAESQGPLRTTGVEAQQSLSLLIQKLSQLN